MKVVQQWIPRMVLAKAKAPAHVMTSIINNGRVQLGQVEDYCKIIIPVDWDGFVVELGVKECL